MSLQYSFKSVYFFLFFTFVVSLATITDTVLGQSSGSGTGTSSPTSSSPGMSGADLQVSDFTSKSTEMPTFPGFDKLEKTSFIGRSESFLFPRTSAGASQSSSSRNTSRTSAGGTASYGSSGNTRTSTTGSRTSSRTSMGSSRNRSTTGMMGNRGGMGGLGGTSTNTVQSVTSLGYSLSSAERSSEPVRAPVIESRINASKVKPLVPVTVEIKDSTAILRGVVKNDHERNLLEQFVKLEPGIHKVQNELLCPLE